MQIFVSDAQLAERYSVDRSTIWRWVKKKILPSPVQLSPGCTRFNMTEVEERDAGREPVVAPSERIVRATLASVKSSKRHKLGATKQASG